MKKYLITENDFRKGNFCGRKLASKVRTMEVTKKIFECPSNPYFSVEIA